MSLSIIKIIPTLKLRSWANVGVLELPLIVLAMEESLILTIQQMKVPQQGPRLVLGLEPNLSLILFSNF